MPTFERLHIASQLARLATRRAHQSGAKHGSNKAKREKIINRRSVRARARHVALRQTKRIL